MTPTPAPTSSSSCCRPRERLLGPGDPSAFLLMAPGSAHGLPHLRRRVPQDQPGAGPSRWRTCPRRPRRPVCEHPTITAAAQRSCPGTRRRPVNVTRSHLLAPPPPGVTIRANEPTPTIQAKALLTVLDTQRRRPLHHPTVRALPFERRRRGPGRRTRARSAGSTMPPEPSGACSSPPPQEQLPTAALDAIQSRGRT